MTTDLLFADHGARLGTGDLDLISQNYAEDAVLVASTGVLHGRAGARAMIGGLLVDLPDAEWSLVPQFALASCLSWSGPPPPAPTPSPDGVDTLVFRDGLISPQTVRYTLTPRSA